MSRVLHVVRLQLINKQTFVWLPLLVLGGATVLSILIYAMIPFPGPKYGGGGQAPLWVFFAAGMTAMTLTFPFSQALSITRRDFFLGTMIAAALGSAMMAVIFLIGGGIEVLTTGWGVNGYIFFLPWLWEAGPLAAMLVYFTVALFLFVVGFTGATIYKRWGPAVLATASIALALVLVAIVFAITRLELWPPLFRGVLDLGALGLALWALGVTAALMGVSFLVLRRATP